MPCTFCNNIFPILPCKHSDGNLDISRISLAKQISRHSAVKMTVVNIYRMLHTNCPCIECLVKMMCKHGVMCPPYHDLLVEAAQHVDKKTRSNS